MKFLGAEEEDLAEGERHVMGDLREAEGGRIAAEEEIQDELLAGGDAGDETAAVARESGRDRVVRALGVIGKQLERRSCGDDRSHGRGGCNRRDEVKHELHRLARLPRHEEIARLLAMTVRTRRDLVAAHDQLVHHQSDSGNRLFLLHLLFVPFFYKGNIHPLFTIMQVSGR